MGGLDVPEGSQQESTVPEEDKFEGRLVPQVWPDMKYLMTSVTL